jgi:hypothetical protein
MKVMEAEFDSLDTTRKGEIDSREVLKSAESLKHVRYYALNAVKLVADNRIQVSRSAFDYKAECRRILCCEFVTQQPPCRLARGQSEFPLPLLAVRSGRKAVRMPSAGRKEQTWYTKLMLV